MPTVEDFRRWEYEYSSWLAAGGAKGFYDFLREVKGIPYQRLNLAAVTDDVTAEHATVTGHGKL